MALMNVLREKGLTVKDALKKLSLQKAGDRSL